MGSNKNPSADAITHTFIRPSFIEYLDYVSGFDTSLVDYLTHALYAKRKKVQLSTTPKPINHQRLARRLSSVHKVHTSFPAPPSFGLGFPA
jgi:hypothetical protein